MLGRSLSCLFPSVSHCGFMLRGHRRDGLTKNLAALGFVRSDSFNMNTELDVRVPTLGWNGLA
ncbi:hypothetical protein CSHISOI_07291 [Colletotrichum shisoi]|uniref:Uncharacterized protein n=1 Tax=Colletotrichum shisoi TaxID=2078593 RepID=A0A5Q4BMG3_9PEZI|nr:hypothetical protein CSHISOI_07291 [Colletotrichum shisoi]